MTKTYEAREITGVVTHGYKVSDARKQYGVFIMPYRINTYICDTKEEAEQWIKRKATE